MTVSLYTNDLPEGLDLGSLVAIDTETMGLKPERDRLCLVQLSSGDGTCHLVHFPPDGSGGRDYAAPRLRAMLASRDVTKLFHFARFDVAVLRRHLRVFCQPIYCTKIASKLVRTYTDRHGLKDLCRELIGVELSKEQQSSDWGAPVLTEAQVGYAASDVLHLHALKVELDRRLQREGRESVARACFGFLPMRAQLDLLGWPDEDIFAH